MCKETNEDVCGENSAEIIEIDLGKEFKLMEVDFEAFRKRKIMVQQLFFQNRVLSVIQKRIEQFNKDDKEVLIVEEVNRISVSWCPDLYLPFTLDRTVTVVIAGVRKKASAGGKQVPSMQEVKLFEEKLGKILKKELKLEDDDKIKIEYSKSHK